MEMIKTQKNAQQMYFVGNLLHKVLTCAKMKKDIIDKFIDITKFHRFPLKIHVLFLCFFNGRGLRRLHRRKDYQTYYAWTGMTYG